MCDFVFKHFVMTFSVVLVLYYCEVLFFLFRNVESTVFTTNLPLGTNKKNFE